MPDKKVLVRFYPETDADLIKWLDGLAAGEGNDTIKAMLRAGIEASNNSNGHWTQQPTVSASVATLDPASLESTLEGFLPRIREIVDASIASANLMRGNGSIPIKDEDVASADILSGHMLGDDDDD